MIISYLSPSNGKYRTLIHSLLTVCNSKKHSKKKNDVNVCANDLNKMELCCCWNWNVHWQKKCENKTKQSDCVNWFGMFVKIEFRCSHNGKLIVTSQIARANMHFRLANNSIIKTKQNKTNVLQRCQFGEHKEKIETCSRCPFK